jgi:hypothetical protein
VKARGDTYRGNSTCPPEIDPAWFFGSCLGSSKKQANGQKTPTAEQIIGKLRSASRDQSPPPLSSPGSSVSTPST